LISMIELATRVLMDRGMTRARAISWVAVASLVLGVPSALSMAFFENQDNVWGVGLLFSGLFFGLAVIKYGVDRFRTQLVNSEGSDVAIGRWFNASVWLVVVEAIALLVWWLSQTLSQEGWAATLDPFATWSLGTILLQFAIVFVFVLAFNRRLARVVDIVEPIKPIGGLG
ncbi:MAG TPA: sodium-dependent transporter, partial [Gemmatimonadota bacterium]|nr:sodium-dependent transporter [Gemmatimonadota bacterium]